MLNLQLYIQDPETEVFNQIEMFADESVTITQSIQEIKDISKIFTDFSKTFNVPASKTNNKLFKHYYNSEVIGFNAGIKFVAKLYLNHQEFKKGKVKMEGVSMKSNKAHTYKLTFFGDTIKLPDLIKDEELQALDALNEYQFEYTHDNLKAYMQDGLDIVANGETIEDAIIVPLITHTDRLYYDSSQATGDTGNLYYAGDSFIRGVKHDQLKPAIRVHAIVKAIEAQYGINFSGEFFNSTNLPYYNLYMWQHRNEGEVFKAEQEGGNESVPFNKVGNFTIETIDDYDKWGRGSAGGEYNRNYIPSGGDFFRFRKAANSSDVKHLLFISVSTTCTDYDTVLYKNGQPHFYTKNGNNLYLTSNSSGYIRLGDSGSNGVDLGPGDYSFYIRSKQNADFDVKFVVNEAVKRLVGIYWDSHKAVFHGSLSIQTTNTFSTSVQVPKMKTMNFLTGLFKMFNLTAYVDSKGIINVVPLNDYYANSKNTWEITEYLDTTESQVSSLIPYKTIDFSFKGLKSIFAANHYSQFGREWGTELYNGNNEGSVFELEVPFEHHKYERIIDPSTNTLTTVQWGWSVDEKKEPYIGEPLLFYGHKIENGTAISFVDNTIPTSPTKSSIDDYYIPLNSVDIDPSQTMNFGAELSEFAIADDFQQFPETLYSTYYGEYIEDTFAQRRRLFNFKAYLPLRILLNLSLADRMVVYDSVYKINKMTTNFQTGVCDLELINEIKGLEVIVTPDSDTEDVSLGIGTVDTTLVTVDNAKTV